MMLPIFNLGKWTQGIFFFQRELLINWILSHLRLDDSVNWNVYAKQKDEIMVSETSSTSEAHISLQRNLA